MLRKGLRGVHKNSKTNQGAIEGSKKLPGLPARLTQLCTRFQNSKAKKKKTSRKKRKRTVV